MVPVFVLSTNTSLPNYVIRLLSASSLTATSRCFLACYYYAKAASTKFSSIFSSKPIVLTTCVRCSASTASLSFLFVNSESSRCIPFSANSNILKMVFLTVCAAQVVHKILVAKQFFCNAYEHSPYRNRPKFSRSFLSVFRAVSIVLTLYQQSFY